MQEQIRWYAINVRVGAEVRLRESLSIKGCQVFLPTALEVRRYSDRLKRVDSPLFPGYLFARFDASKSLPFITTPGVHSIVSIDSVPWPIDDYEIEAIMKVVSSGASAIPWPFLNIGDKVKITFGPLTGVEGFLVRTNQKEQLVLSINLLQRSLAVEIDRSFIRPLVDYRSDFRRLSV